MPASRPTRDCVPNLVSYEAERDRFALSPPERFNPVLDILEAWAREDPEALALVSLDSAGETAAEHTVRALAEESRRAARMFLDLGLGKGDRIFVMLPRVPAWYAAVLGAIRIGAVPMPGPNLLTAKDIAYRVATAEAVAVVVDGPGVEKIEAASGELPTVRHRIRWTREGGPTEVGWLDLEAGMRDAGDGPTPSDPTAADDPMLVYFTSGTVAQPKMVLHTQASLGLGHVITARYWQDLREGDLHWTISDTGWAKAA